MTAGPSTPLYRDPASDPGAFPTVSIDSTAVDDTTETFSITGTQGVIGRGPIEVRYRSRVAGSAWGAFTAFAASPVTAVIARNTLLVVEMEAQARDICLTDLEGANLTSETMVVLIQPQLGALGSDGELEDGAVTEPKIASLAVTESKISVPNLAAISADIGNITAGTLEALVIVASGTFTAADAIFSDLTPPTSNFHIRIAGGSGRFTWHDATGNAEWRFQLNTSDPTELTLQKIAVDGTLFFDAAVISTNRQIISTLASGTAPFAPTSTTVCTNLNADLLDGSHASAFATSSHTHAAGDITAGTFPGTNYTFHTAPASAFGSVLRAREDFSASSGTSQAVRFETRQTVASTGTIAALGANAESRHSSGIVATIIGLSGTAQAKATSSGATTWLRGVAGNAGQAGASIVTSAAGLYGHAPFDSGAGSLLNAYALFLEGPSVGTVLNRLVGTDVAGCFCTAAGVWTSTSTRVAKKNIKVLPAAEAIAALESFEVTTFRRKTAEVHEKNWHEVGVIVEDLPSIVASPGSSGVASGRLASLAIAGWHAHHTQIKDLVERIELLEAA